MRKPPIWTKEDRAYYSIGGADLAVCKKCGRRLEIGEAYWLDEATMIIEPPHVFHDRCPEPSSDP